VYVRLHPDIQMRGGRLECSAVPPVCSYDELSASRICTVCRDLVLMCPLCAAAKLEYHCAAHQPYV
jgi:hypothetical protein